MHYLSRFFRRLKPLRQSVSQIKRLGFLLLGAGIAVVLFASRANAAETVLLRYFDQTLSVPQSQLQAFTDEGILSPELADFFQKTQEDPDAVREWLTAKISVGANAVLPEKFVLLQINKTLGDSLEREDLDSLRKALSDAFVNDKAFSVMEVLEKYPKRDVRLTLNRLGQAYTDINLFVTRVNPILNVAKELLPELVCECTVTPDNNAASVSANTVAQPETKAANAYSKATSILKTAFAIADQPTDATSAALTPVKLQLAANITPTAYANKRLVLDFGPFRPSISIADLTKFVETGELSRGWRFYFNVANVDREGLRKALSQEVRVDVKSLDKQLNSLLGEYVLYEIGQIIQTPSGTANIQALRSAIILSAIKDNHFSALELLQNYPLQQVNLNAIRLARYGAIAKRFQDRGGVTTAITDIETWLLQLQATASENICDCDLASTVPNPIVTAPIPEISPLTVAQYLPANWQPVPSHREDRGNVKVVWLQGTPYEMGYQHGQLLHEEIASIGKEVLTAARLIGQGLALGRLASKRSYPELIEECRGLVDATQDLGITLDSCMVIAYADVFQEILGYTLPQELFWEGCNQFVATNGATIDGQLYHGSSVDNGKPVPYVINNSIIFVRQPTNGLPHVFVGYPGAIWPNSGMNVASISIGLDTAHPDSANELALIGRSNVQIMARILETATSFDDAQTIMETQPRVRANLIMITDGKSRQAGVFEFTGKNLGVRELQENGVLYVTNHFVLSEMYEKQPLPIDPSSESRFNRFKQLMEPDQPSSYYGQINPEVMAKILRDRVNPYTQQASPFDVFDDNASPGGNGSLRQAIYDPAGLRLWIAAGQPPVPENPFTCFSMRELLNLPNATPCQTPAM